MGSAGKPFVNMGLCSEEGDPPYPALKGGETRSPTQVGLFFSWELVLGLPYPKCAGFLLSQVPLGGFSLLFLPCSLVEPQLCPGDAGGSSDPSPTGHGSCHQHRCAPPGKGSLRPAAGLGPSPVIALEGKDLQAVRAGQSGQGIPPPGPSCRPGAFQEL